MRRAAPRGQLLVITTILRIAAGIGFVWGKGELVYGGQKHPFKLSGVSIADVGGAHITASGIVYNQTTLDDFNGNYTAVTAGVTVGGGGSAAILRNATGSRVAQTRG